jgi:hypothetical protein
MPSHLIAFLRPSFLALLAFGAIVGVVNLFWSADRSFDARLAGLSSSELAGVNLGEITFPHPELSPEEVVRLQLAGLSDRSADGSGILQCFCLASPANRIVTGPLERFGQMVRDDPYRCMSHPRAVLIGRPQYGDDVARLLVTIIDDHHEVRAFAFVLAKQKGAPFADCWMTEAVLSTLPAPRQPPAPPEQV